MDEKNSVTIKLDSSDCYIAILHIHEKEDKETTRTYSTGFGKELFTVLIAEYSTKLLEERIGQLQEAITHQGWLIRS